MVKSVLNSQVSLFGWYKSRHILSVVFIAVCGMSCLDSALSNVTSVTTYINFLHNVH